MQRLSDERAGAAVQQLQTPVDALRHLQNCRQRIDQLLSGLRTRRTRPAHGPLVFGRKCLSNGLWVSLFDREYLGFRSVIPLVNSRLILYHVFFLFHFWIFCRNKYFICLRHSFGHFMIFTSRKLDMSQPV